MRRILHQSIKRDPRTDKNSTMPTIIEGNKEGKGISVQKDAIFGLNAAVIDKSSNSSSDWSCGTKRDKTLETLEEEQREERAICSGTLRSAISRANRGLRCDSFLR